MVVAVAAGEGCRVRNETRASRKKQEGAFRIGREQRGEALARQKAKQRGALPHLGGGGKGGGGLGRGGGDGSGGLAIQRAS